MAENLTNSSLLSVNGILSNPAIFGVRVLFYALSPGEASFEELDQVPNYVAIVTPFFMMAIFLEIIIHAVKGQQNKMLRSNDAMSSIAQGFFSQLPLLLMRNIELSAYLIVYKRYCIVELPWDSAATWWFTMLAVDLGYYWVHRMAHEVNFMWAAHQVHHSSEDYNLSTALRQSILQRYSSWMFYLPIALFVPPPIFIVHIQLNLLYQFWIHTELVHKLGPLEWILNTPSHHRVHHGRNRYCIDCNYAGVLIVWDRIFGTFHPEDDNDEIAYGLVHPVNSWDSIYIQFCHWKYLLVTAWNIPGWKNKVFTFIKGPGWTPGKARLGDIQDIPDIHGKQKTYNKSLPLWLNLYAWLHFVAVLVARTVLDDHKQNLSAVGAVVAVLYFLWAITNIGFIYEHKWYAWYLELLRCLVTVGVVASYSTVAPGAALVAGIQAMYGASCVICLMQSGRQIQAAAGKQGKVD